MSGWMLLALLMSSLPIILLMAIGYKAWKKQRKWRCK